jgi:pSer/pThr/pTyr-binding forkhead associated (FHA) protein
MIDLRSAISADDGRATVDQRIGESVASIFKAPMKSFLTACGLEESLQLVVESQRGDEDELRLLHQPFAVIGRDPRADVVLDHPQVSRRHVYFQVIEDRAFWVDLESRTGTRSEREPQRFGWLDERQSLRIGPYVVRRFVGNAANDKQADRGSLPRDTPLVALAYSRAPLPEVSLEFLNGPSQSTSRPVHRVMSLIGSASGCKFRLTDPTVSRFHASLLRTSMGLWIVDLLGHGGVSVNEKSVRFDHLVDGDIVRIGRYRLRVLCCFRGEVTKPRKTSDFGQPTLVGKLPRRERPAKGFSIRDWTTAAIPFEPRPESIKAARLPVPVHRDPPKVEVIAPNAGLAGKLTQSDATPSVLVPLVNQFGMMQQQMFDQFQQAIAMMVQMFGEMHRDQMDVIREELGRLHELTDEFNALKAELAGRSGNESADSAKHHQLVLSKASSLPSSAGAQFQGNGEQISESALTQPRLPSVSSTIPSIKHAQTEPLVAAEPLPDQLRSAPVANKPVTVPAPRETPAGLAPTKSQDATRPSTDNDRDTVLWLHQRIAILQQERESRWQKILKLLPGMS